MVLFKAYTKGTRRLKQRTARQAFRALRRTKLPRRVVLAAANRAGQVASPRLQRGRGSRLRRNLRRRMSRRY